jgi:hypothetical protein
MATKAKESSQVKKLREKLKNQINVEQKRVTKQALHQMNEVIKSMLKRHNAERVSLKQKAFTVYGKGAKYAPKSKFVERIERFIRSSS